MGVYESARVFCACRLLDESVRARIGRPPFARRTADFFLLSNLKSIVHLSSG